MSVELTVAMPTYDVGRFLEQAISSVLDQEGVDLELIVVDDGSTDETPEILARFSDPRLRVFRNERRLGIGASHNRVLENARGTFIAHVDSDDFVLPGALRAMVDALEANPAAGLAHCYFFDVDEEGRLSRLHMLERWSSFRRDRRPGVDYRAALAHMAGVVNHLRTYRRVALEQIGGFDTSLSFAVDYDSSLRLLEHWEACVVPEFLYGRRVHRTNTSEAMRWREWRVWWQKVYVRQRVLHSGAVSYLEGNQVDLGYFLAGRRNHWKKKLQTRSEGRKKARRLWVWRFVRPAQARFYRWLTRIAPTWPLGGGILRGAGPSRTAAYSATVFPVLSETFVQREVQALLDIGVDLHPFAVMARSDHWDDLARRLHERTWYHSRRVVDEEFRSSLRRLGLPRAWALLRVWLFATLHRWTETKSFPNDALLFRRCVVVAARMLELGAGQIHATWGDEPATVAMLAARLAGARFTMQLRAFDLHRGPSTVGLDERLLRAAEVITNSRLNADVVERKTGGRLRPRVVYEGIDLSRFPAADRQAREGTSMRVLCVARLVPQKGLDDLLRTWRILIDRGSEARLEIVGGPVKGNERYVEELQSLQADLGLSRVVTFRGAISFDRVLDCYRTSDLVVLAAREGPLGARDVTPNALLEAMAAGLPVVSTRFSAIPEIVNDGVTGLLVAPADPESFADAVQRLEDPALRAEMGAAARRHVEARFDISKNVRSLAETYGFGVVGGWEG